MPGAVGWARLAKGVASVGGAVSGAPREVRRRGAGDAGVVGVGWGALRGSAAGVRWIGAASPARGLVWGCGAGVKVAAGFVGAVGCGVCVWAEAGGALRVPLGTATRWVLGAVGSVARAAEVRAGEGELAARVVLAEGAGVAAGIAGVLADPVEAAARCTGAESGAAEGPTGPGDKALGLADAATTGRAGAMPRATAGVVDVPAGADPGLGGTATGPTGAAVGPAGPAALCATGGVTGTGTRAFGAEPWDTSTGLSAARVDVCTTAAFDTEEGSDAGPDEVAAERPADVVADPGETEPDPEPEPDGVATGLTGTAVDPAGTAALCTAAGASTGRADTAAAAPDAPGANWTDAAPEPGEAAVGRTGEAAAAEVTSGATESTEVETPAEGPGTTPRDTGTATGTSGAPAPVPPPELPMGAPAACFLATGRLRRCTTGAPETLVSGTAPATDEDTATEETPEPALPVPAEDPPSATGSAPAETGTAPAAGRHWTAGTALATGRCPTTGTAATAAAAPAAEPAPEDAPAPEDDDPSPERPTTGTTRGPAALATTPGNITR
ncbi:hypothetical protein ACFYXF_21210 [Streptomyces sp. NPDC002680]|uniref:hypothetical protein n=1 Tax=Streptomyces sp. NPDC002680 TaxID=3364659 RepID=UPI0036787834